MTTASYSGGTMFPVLTLAASGRVTGFCSLAPTVSALLTAIPSIAEIWMAGTENLANMGSAVIRPTAPVVTGIRTTPGTAWNEFSTSASASASVMTERYRFTTVSPQPPHRPQAPHSSPGSAPAPHSAPGC